MEDVSPHTPSWSNHSTMMCVNIVEVENLELITRMCAASMKTNVEKPRK